MPTKNVCPQRIADDLHISVQVNWVDVAVSSATFAFSYGALLWTLLCTGSCKSIARVRCALFRDIGLCHSQDSWPEA